MIHCAECGSPNVDAARVCETCGAVLARTGQTPATPRPSYPPPFQPLHQPAYQPAYQPPHPPYGAAPPAADELSTRDQRLLFVGNLCLSPMLGVVLWFLWRDQQPRRAQQVCTLTRWVVGLWAAFFVLAMLVSVLAGA